MKNIRTTGFSLIEVMVAVVIMISLALAVAEVFINTRKAETFIFQSQSVYAFQSTLREVFANRTTCERNFQGFTVTTLTPQPLQLVNQLGDPLVVPGQNYDNSIQIESFELANFQRAGTVGDNVFRGTIDLNLILRKLGQSIGPTVFKRSLKLSVELEGLAGGIATGRIQSCTTVGKGTRSLWSKNDIGNLLFNSSGTKVAIGLDTDPFYKLQVNGKILADQYWGPSDINYKEHIKNITGLDIINRFTPSLWRSKHNGQIFSDLSADDIKKTMPEAVFNEPHQALSAIDYHQLIAPLIEASKELYSQNKELRQALQQSRQRRQAIEKRLGAQRD